MWRGFSENCHGNLPVDDYGWGGPREAYCYWMLLGWSPADIPGLDYSGFMTLSPSFEWQDIDRTASPRHAFCFPGFESLQKGLEPLLSQVSGGITRFAGVIVSYILYQFKFVSYMLSYFAGGARKTIENWTIYVMWEISLEAIHIITCVRSGRFPLCVYVCLRCAVDII